MCYISDVVSVVLNLPGPPDVYFTGPVESKVSILKFCRYASRSPVTRKEREYNVVAGKENPAEDCLGARSIC